jgi:hypothetical protein
MRAMTEPEPDDLDAPDAQDHKDAAQRLPSFSDVNLSVGQFLAGLEQKVLHNRPPAVVVVEEEARGEQVATSGLVVTDLPTDPLDRPEPPDTSGAKL